jgi:hypothetical protein
MRFSVVLFFLIFSSALFPQKSIKVENIKGSSSVSGDISPNEARLQALNNAKIDALKAAGIDEQISTYQLLFSSQLKNDYSQFFSSDIQSEMQGAVKNYKVLSEKMYCKNELEVAYDVTIDATVVKYDTRPDLAFTSNIDGIKGVYNNGENLSFSLKATRNCYLTIFNITDKEATLLYPNDYEKQFELKKLESYNFPMAKIDYTLGNETKKPEVNRLIFVFTKEQIPYIKADKKQVTTHEDIFGWIYSIPPDQRKTEYFTLNISN